MKKHTTSEATINSGFLFKKRKGIIRPVENDEIFDHLFIKTNSKKYRGIKRKLFAQATK